MSRVAHITVLAAIAAMFLIPISTSALGLLGESFGGQIIDMNFCANGGIVVTLRSATFPGLPVESYIWTAGLTFGVPPWHIGQSIMGVADIPYFCFGPGKHPLEYFGMRMRVDAVSL